MTDKGSNALLDSKPISTGDPGFEVNLDNNNKFTPPTTLPHPKKVKII